MKLSFFLLLFFALSFSGCKSGHKMRTVSPPEEIAPVVQNEKEAEPVTVRTESFSFELSQDGAVHDPNRFFVIIGSFRFSSNANTFKDKASEKGLNPFVIVSERGYHRIAAFSYADEKQARAGVKFIRANFPDYSDVWLLIRK
jgi:hypothetical protein